MIFGLVDQFAVEANFVERYEKFLYGNLRLWVGGLSVGNYEDSMDLAASARWTKTFLNHSGSRTWAGIDDALPEEVFERLYLWRLKRGFESKGVGRLWGLDRFAVTLDGVGDSSTEGLFGILAVRGEDESDRVIAMDLETENICHTKLLAGSLDSILGRYLNWVIGLCPTVLDTIEYE